MYEQKYFAAGCWIRDYALKALTPLPRSLAVFGSFVRGDMGPVSDIDVLCVGNAIPRRPFQRTEWFFSLSNAWRHYGEPSALRKHPISPVYLTCDGWSNSIGLRLSLCHEAWILWDDGLLSVTLEESRRLIERGDWSRKDTADGGWLWIPKEKIA